jgi:hypothetical protein
MLLASLVVLWCACSVTERTVPTSNPRQTEPDLLASRPLAPDIPLGSFVSRNGILRVASTPGGVVYTVVGADGNVLADGVTAAELRVRLPQYYLLLEAGLAWGSR